MKLNYILKRSQFTNNILIKLALKARYFDLKKVIKLYITKTKIVKNILIENFFINRFSKKLV